MLTKDDIHSLGREIDEIEDIRRCFEDSYTRDYFDPESGDRISDDYLKVIDLTTQPGALNEQALNSLNQSIQHLNQAYPFIERQLGRAGLLDTYYDVMQQINMTNAAIDCE